MMDSVKSFKGYGKVDPLEEQAYRRKTRRRLIILAVSLVLLIALIVGAVVGTVAHKKSGSGDSKSTSPSGTSSAQSIKAMCSVTEYPDSCFSSISAMEGANSTTDPKKLFQLSLQVVMDSLEELSGLPETWSESTSDPELKSAFNVCQVVFQDAIDSTNDSISLFTPESNSKVDPLSPVGIRDLKTWLSTTLTNLDTCIDAIVELNNTDPTILNEVKTSMSNSTQFASNSLAIAAKFIAFLNKFIPPHRRLLSEVGSSGFPSWVKAADRKLLQAPAGENPKADVVVASDGSGDYKTIKEALGKVPTNSDTRFVIYVKAGVYSEKVTVEKQMWNVYMYGDGKNKTIVTGSANFVDKTPTFRTATFGKSKTYKLFIWAV
ncbi:OLC1v1015248C2 [Oldenlandia corymbosa var. corymbosa]|uniref:pectinesterase n=1 Tax=Oldenlandia corymbosa var. corymbosa TaxID=529605 RepID=A0AAV1E2Z9_OLDCO|nr:OLC1v1015248C2 [Oldenlandia corymbosa var. corymbosa]